MTTLSELGIPHNGFDILQPNLKHRFQIRFLDSETDEKLAVSDALTKQAVRVFGVIERRENPMDISGIIFQDDITNVAFKALLTLQTIKEFTVAIDVLDGNETILRTTLLKNAKLESFYHGDFDYAAVVSKSELEFEAFFPDRMGTAINMINENPLGAAILNAFSGAQLRIKGGKKSNETAVSELQAQFSFEDIQYEFHNFNQKSSG